MRSDDESNEPINAPHPKTDLSCYAPNSIAINFCKPASEQEVLKGTLHVLVEVSYDLLFAVIVLAHPMWVCLLTWFVFDYVP
jgi:hypothetical protein